MTRISASLIVAALLTAGLAAAQAYDEERTSTSALGTITLPKDVRAEGGSVEITADVSLDIAKARQAGASSFSVSAGNDQAPTGVAVQSLTLNADNGDVPEPGWSEGEGTNRQSHAWSIGDLPDRIDGTLTFTVMYPEDTGYFDVEAVAVAMDANHRPISSGSGSFELQSWTGVHPQAGGGDGDVGFNANDTNDTTDDDAGNNTPGGGNDSDPEETTGGNGGGQNTPAPGLAAVALTALAAAVGLRRRR